MAIEKDATLPGAVAVLRYLIFFVICYLYLLSPAIFMASRYFVSIVVLLQYQEVHLQLKYFNIPSVADARDLFSALGRKPQPG